MSKEEKIKKLVELEKDLSKCSYYIQNLGNRQLQKEISKFADDCLGNSDYGPILISKLILTKNYGNFKFYQLKFEEKLNALKTIKVSISEAMLKIQSDTKKGK